MGVRPHLRRTKTGLVKVRGHNRSHTSTKRDISITPKQTLKNVKKSYERIKSQGQWPDHIGESTLTSRIPTDEEEGYGGFDAGIACALDLIPKEKQFLASSLHAAYTPEAIQQIRKEMIELDPDSETTWWAAACWTCEEGKVTWDTFSNQLDWFQQLRDNEELRVEAAETALQSMSDSFEVIDGVPWSTRDGGAIGAYLNGHDMVISYAPNYGIFFVSTYKPSLGIPDNFEWEDDISNPRSNSGPVHGSKQYIKAASDEELKRLLKYAKPS